MGHSAPPAAATRLITGETVGAATTRTLVQMGTVVRLAVYPPTTAAEAEPALERASDWFRRVEAVCSRFDPASELCRACRRVGVPVPISDLLYQAVAFALVVAEASGGAFDPTLGATLIQRGFNEHYLTGQPVDLTGQAVDLTGQPVDRLTTGDIAAAAGATYRAIELDAERRTMRLRQPLLLDLGAVAKGLAVDLAARELAALPSFTIDAGGDLYVSATPPAGQRWSVGIRHPRQPDAICAVLAVGGQAICTSGDYERVAGATPAHHLIDPRRRRAATALASVTVIAPTAMVADALSTAAFVLGPRRGRRLLEQQGVAGLLITPSLEQITTIELERYLS